MSDERAGYDMSEVPVRGIFWFILGFCAAMGILLFLVWEFQASLVAPSAGSAFAAPTQEQPLQPSPNHPTTPAQDMQKLRAEQRGRLEAGDAARHEIPIAQAMDELMKSGALTRPWKNPATQPYVRPPNEPAGHSVENRS